VIAVAARLAERDLALEDLLTAAVNVSPALHVLESVARQVVSLASSTVSSPVATAASQPSASSSARLIQVRHWASEASRNSSAMKFSPVS
jgi:hypothetical protein